tara:strand:+ start:225 stop:359 length:135 start_codon:yes stop_codon:yes gene_type:complete
VLDLNIEHTLPIKRKKETQLQDQAFMIKIKINLSHFSKRLSVKE